MQSNTSIKERFQIATVALLSAFLFFSIIWMIVGFFTDNNVPIVYTGYAALAVSVTTFIFPVVWKYILEVLGGILAMFG